MVWEGREEIFVKGQGLFLGPMFVISFHLHESSMRIITVLKKILLKSKSNNKSWPTRVLVSDFLNRVGI